MLEGMPHGFSLGGLVRQRQGDAEDAAPLGAAAVSAPVFPLRGVEVEGDDRPAKVAIEKGAGPAMP